MASSSSPASKSSNRSSIASLSGIGGGREPVAGSVEYLERCRHARHQEQQVARQEEDRLQQILSFCEEYNRECDRFFQLERALHRSGPRTPARYLFARRDNISFAEASDQTLLRPPTSHSASPLTPTKAYPAANSINQNNNLCRDYYQTNGESLVPPPASSCGNGTGSWDAVVVMSDSQIARDQSLSPASTITDQNVNGRKDHQNILPHANDCHSSVSRRHQVRGGDCEQGTAVVDGEEEEEEEDEELKEFQALENEVNLTESIAKSLDERLMDGFNRMGTHGSFQNGGRGSRPNSRIVEAINAKETSIDVDCMLVPLAQAERSGGSLGTPDSSDATITAASSQESEGKLTTTTAGTDFSSLFMSIHASMRKKKGKASSLPPNEIFGVNSSTSDANRSHLLRAFDSLSMKQGAKDRRRASSVHPAMSRSLIVSHGHANKGLIAEMKFLGHNVSAFTSDDLQMSCCTCSGYLWKLCSDQKKWKKRFFHFDRHHKVFFYYHTADQFRKVKKPNGGVGFIELRDVAVDRQRSRIGSPLRTGSDPNLREAGLSASRNGGSDGSSNSNTSSSNNNNSISNNGKKNSQRNPKYATFLRNNKKPNLQKEGDRSRSSSKDDPRSSTSSSSSPFRFVFDVETKDRTFILSTHSFELMRLWVDVIFTGIESYFG